MHYSVCEYQSKKKKKKDCCFFLHFSGFSVSAISLYEDSPHELYLQSFSKS